MILRARVAPLCLMALYALPGRADEGMWTFEHAPVERIGRDHGLALSPKWLSHLQRAAVSFDASASFVSARGLMLTNHHVAMDCIEQLSTDDRNLVRDGHVALRPEDELRCPGATARVLVSSEDVTAALSAAAADAPDAAARTARRKAERARLESACAAATGLECEVVSLYSGAVYRLYRYQEWDDVRLVFAPEAQAANFGGDPDNFVYPRYALDLALLRVWHQGRPVEPAAHLRLAARPVAEGELVFVAGHPGRTQRLWTRSQVAVHRDVQLPLRMATAIAALQRLRAYAARSPEAARLATGRIESAENWLKSMRGEAQALADPALQASQAAAEAAFRTAYARQGLPGDPWAVIEAAMQRQAATAAELWLADYGWRTVLQMAGQLVELAYERQLPESERLPDYRGTAIAELERSLAAPVPVAADLQAVLLTGLFDGALRGLGPDHPYVRLVLAGAAPEAAAARMLATTGLADAAARAALLKGGAAAVEASGDPLLRLARQIYPLRRAALRRAELEVASPVQQAAEALGQARYALYGHDVPPDATGTLRLSYGRVAGYVSAGITVPWKTTWGGLYARADSFDGKAPFDLPPRLAAARSVVDPRTPLNFASTADIIGGNSGSPVVNAAGEWVGLIFDSNLEGLAAGHAYSSERARAVAVHAQAVLTALEQVYGARALADELRGR